MTSPWALLDRLPDVRVLWTDDERALKGKRARWYPKWNVIAIDKTMRRLKARCSLAHELGHVVLGHPESCGHEFYDQRIEAEADEFAARLLLDDLAEIAHELAISCNHGHAAHNLNVTLDLFEVRLFTLRPDEERYVRARVAELLDDVGA